MAATVLLLLIGVAAVAAGGGDAGGSAASVSTSGDGLSDVRSSIGGWDDLGLLRSKVAGLTPEEVYEMWLRVRAEVIAPALQAVVVVCLVMSVMLVMEAVYMSVVSLGVKLIGWKPEKHYKWEPIADDEEKGSQAYPVVLVQIPMYNELEVYKVSIGAACELNWPKDRLFIQVLDDSTNPLIRNLVESECQSWESKGINIKYITRSERKGFKAGAMKEGMECSYVQHCEYVAIFDADFQPEPDFLLQTVPYLVHNPRVALVQTRWEFVNHTDSLMTRIQKMSLDYHFKVEQEASSATFAFFSFNGTAGIWRAETIRDAGGWKDRTTVEDMDLAVRACLKGWKFVYVGDIRVKSELPTTYHAYCRQQHRWACGAANLFRKMAWDIVVAKDVSRLKKFYILYSFFLVRRVVAPLVSFFLYCVILPVSVMIPELILPVWAVAYIPTTLLIVTAIRHPKALHIMPIWLLFESVMTMHRMRAAVVGLLETANFNEWIVTKKVGNNFKDNTEVPLLEKAKAKLREKINFSEIWFSMFLFFCATYNLVFSRSKSSYFINLYLQALAFFVLGFNYVGTCDCCS